MKLRKLIFGGLFFSLLFVWACNRTEDDFNGDKSLGGRLMYVDSLQFNSLPVPLPHRLVKIALNGSDTLNYLYAVQTDTAGYFTFQQLKQKGAQYDIYFEDTVGGVPAFAFRGSLTPEVDTILLKAAPDYLHQRILHFIVTDNGNNPLSNVNLCVFNSAALYVADSCAGSVYQLTTDAFGRATVFNVPVGSYYVRADVVINGSDLKGTAGAIGVPAAPLGVTTSPIVVSPVYSLANLSIQVVDTAHEAVDSVTVCVFDNNQVFASDTAASTCYGSIAQVLTDGYGQGLLTGLRYGTYYFEATAKFGNLSLKGVRVFTLNSPGNSVVTITVR